jgi:glutathione S-transferase
MHEITLYSSKICPFAHRCRLALAEVGMPYSLVEIDLRNKPHWYKDINPKEEVPAIKQNGFVLTESLVINEFINDLAGTHPLMPESPQQKARVRRCIISAENALIPSFYRLLQAQNEEELIKAKDRMNKALQLLETDLHLFKGPYFFGQMLTLADIAVYPWFERWPAIEYYRRFSWPRALNALERWLVAMQTRQSVKNNLCERSFYIKHYGDYARGDK